jgi:NAD(P)-dependent dehydrogenase (short-subunit alcohol dehydrogenase family)
MRLKDKIAIVTGAGAGIGRAIALLFAREGATVVVGEIVEERGKEVVEEIEKGGGQALFVSVDIAATGQIERLFDRTIETYGRLDILVNNAYGSLALIKRDGKLLDVDEELWDTVMTTTLKSVYCATRRGVREMLKSGGGSIVNMSSVNGLFAFGEVAYSTAKGGIVALTRCACMQYADRGIRMNVIAPGTVETASTSPALADPETRRKTEALYSRGSIGKPEEIAATALFLASDESTFLNGAVIVADGGLTVGPVKFELVDRLSDGE